ncbi:hypothetical protein ID852_01345 [Xenorhabdus sp. 42]|uniref:hypothetical protein n=1 Tax=Xenorhabdus szentirmaii TaxID=290112 RepID=UPI001994324D|nr:hypothetical protein [Xenorhabdus sp. 42]MBD2819360.1 hypothetical protein [Xenorhabdus sp. 42]
MSCAAPTHALWPVQVAWRPLFRASFFITVDDRVNSVLMLSIVWRFASAEYDRHFHRIHRIRHRYQRIGFVKVVASGKHV